MLKLIASGDVNLLDRPGRSYIGCCVFFLKIAEPFLETLHRIRDLDPLLFIAKHIKTPDIPDVPLNKKLPDNEI